MTWLFTAQPIPPPFLPLPPCPSLLASSTSTPPPFLLSSLCLSPLSLLSLPFPPSIAWGRGDPHIKTLDGRDYTFNGLGEYILSQTLETNPEFYIQGRTSQVPDVQATEFTAFCFGNNISCVMVGLSIVCFFGCSIFRWYWYLFKEDQN